MYVWYIAKYPALMNAQTCSNTGPQNSESVGHVDIKQQIVKG